jgi:hypothetical protein
MNGLLEKRAGALIDINKDTLAERMTRYFDPTLSWPEYRSTQRALTEPQGRFAPEKARLKAIKAESFSAQRLVRYMLRAFDARWAYYTGIRPVWNEPRPKLWEQVSAGNTFLMTRPSGVASPEGVPFHVTALLGDNDALRGHAYYIPFLQARTKQSGSLFATEQTKSAEDGNLSPAALGFLRALRINGGIDLSLPWYHVLAIGHSPAYLSENADGIRRDWPRIPLPASKDALLKSAELGGYIAEILNTEVEVKGVTAGTIRRELKVIGNTTAAEDGPLDDPARDLLIDAGWGHAGKEGATMPGKGKLIERDYTNAEHEAIVAGAANLGLTPEQAFAQLGERTCDVYLNARAYWKNIPLKVWDYYIGGYQVIKKWLSYREGKLLGRALTTEEARYVTAMARRIAAICLLQPDLDANYAAVKADTYPWPRAK